MNYVYGNCFGMTKGIMIIYAPFTSYIIDFPPVFHIKLRDHVLLEGDPVTLSCLPAGSPHPRITWMKGMKPNKCSILAFDD